MFPKALKSCPKSNKLPNLVTLLPTQQEREREREELKKEREMEIVEAKIERIN